MSRPYPRRQSPDLWFSGPARATRDSGTVASLRAWAGRGDRVELLLDALVTDVGAVVLRLGLVGALVDPAPAGPR